MVPFIRSVTFPFIISEKYIKRKRAESSGFLPQDEKENKK